MSDKKGSEMLYPVYYDNLQKFDHFITGGTIAICGYLAQSIPFAKVGFNIPTIFMGSLLLFCLSAFFSYKRLEKTGILYRYNIDLLEAQEAGDKQKADKIRPHTSRLSKLTHYYYILRSWFLFAGFVVYLVAKMAEPYAVQQ